MKCPKCGTNDKIKYRVSFMDDDERGDFYIRVDGSRDSTKKVKWYDNYFEALNDMNNNLPCAYPYFQMVEGICCNKFLFSDGHYNEAHEEAIEYNKHQQRLDNVLSKFENLVYYPVGFSQSRGKFYMIGNYKKIEISLNTVESLIKDLENEN